MTIKAIPTMYRGTQFRSRLEARWAEFFDRIGLVWQYEPEGYETSAGRYLPDFYLPHVHHRGRPASLFFEVKPTRPTATEDMKLTALVCGTGIAAVVPAGMPGGGKTEFLIEYKPYEGPDGIFCGTDEGLTFAKCGNCGQLDIGVYSSDEPMCSCGKARFSPFDIRLDNPRFDFPNLARWAA